MPAKNVPPKLCSVKGCENTYDAKGFCGMHYMRFRRYGDPLRETPPFLNPRCSIEGCLKPALARHWCSAHYKRWQDHGNPIGGEPAFHSAEERFWASVLKTDSCWEWQGSLSEGYGSFRFRRQYFKVHRFAYELLLGPIRVGFEIDHLCRNRRCVNPAHLELVNHRENTLRGITWVARNARKTHCPKGHPYDLLNTYWYQGRRYCRACNKAKHYPNKPS